MNQPTTRSLNLEMTDKHYNPFQCSHVYTNGSAVGAVNDGNRGIYIKHRDGRKIKETIATGLISSNCRTDAMTLFEALKTIRTEITNPPANFFFFFNEC
jgi:predicted type IV restriction endonuclease